MAKPSCTRADGLFLAPALSARLARSPQALQGGGPQAGQAGTR